MRRVRRGWLPRRAQGRCGACNRGRSEGRVPALSASLEAVMVREVQGAPGLKKLLADERLNAVLLGPGTGAGKATKAAVEAAAKARRALVLDADAISSFTRESGKLGKLLKLNRIQALLTPHDGEFARLFMNGPAQVTRIESKIEKVRAAAKRLGAVVLLKGPDTVVAAPDGRVTVANNAPRWRTSGVSLTSRPLCGGCWIMAYQWMRRVGRCFSMQLAG